MTAPAKVLGFALALVLAGCSGKSGDTTGPNPEPETNDPGTPAPNQGGVAGSYRLEQINNSTPGQLVTLTNPDGQVIGLLRFDPASTLELDPKQAFHLALRYTDDKEALVIDDSGRYDPGGPVSQDGTLPLTFSSAFYGDEFSGAVQGNSVAIEYDFDGDGQLDTSFSFRLVPGD